MNGLRVSLTVYGFDPDQPIPIDAVALGSGMRHHRKMNSQAEKARRRPAKSRTSEKAAADVKAQAGKPTITGARSELGRLLAAQKVAGRVHFNLAGQQANTLLHDGHAWAGFAKSALAGARRAVRCEADLLVHASFSFIRVEAPDEPLRSIAQTIQECEDIVLSGPVPCCVVRLAYLYGPQSQDLLAYRQAFKLGRPYWAGPRKALQDHLHLQDAVSALLAAARPGNAGKVFYASDGTPLPFMSFMDAFARRVGRSCPLHVPRLAAPLIRLVVRKEHMQQVALSMPAQAPKPMVPGWKPVYADYRAGLDQVIDDWKTSVP